MGSSASKAARGAVRQYPSRSPGAAVSQVSVRTESQPKKPLPETSKDDAVRTDGTDPDLSPRGFSQRLHQMGMAQPNPTFSPSSTASPEVAGGHYAAPHGGPAIPSAKNNTTLFVLEARGGLQQRAEQDFQATGRAGSPGKRFMDMRTLIEAMRLRDRGVPPTEIERKLRLEPRLLEKMGPPGLLSHATSAN